MFPDHSKSNALL